MSNELVEEVTPEVARNLSANEKKLKIEELRQQETTIKNGIADPKNIIHAMVFESQNILFSRWANNIKQLHYLGEYTEPINTICRYIKKQIGKMDALSLEKKENIYRNVERSLTSDFKENQDERQIVAENTSDLVEVEKSILVQMLKVFREYHRRFEELADTLLSHFENHENGLQILKDFENVLEWTEIATFCAPLEAMITPIHKLAHFENKLDEALEDYQKFDTLKAIDDDLNLRESATTIQQAMEKILIADGMFRQWAHKFAISPRQNQRIRQRLEDWPEKDAKIVIQKVLGSWLCPCGCGHDIITGKKHFDITDVKSFLTYRLRDSKLPQELKIPDKWKKEGLNPIEIAEKVFGKKLVLVPVT